MLYNVDVDVERWYPVTSDSFANPTPLIASSYNSITVPLLFQWDTPWSHWTYFLNWSSMFGIPSTAWSKNCFYLPVHPLEINSVPILSQTSSSLCFPASEKKKCVQKRKISGERKLGARRGAPSRPQVSRRGGLSLTRQTKLGKRDFSYSGLE